MKYKFAPAFINTSLASLYDPFTNFFGVGSQLQKISLESFPLSDEQSLLDIGCGTGTFVLLAKKKYPNTKITGADPDENVLAIAKDKAQKESVSIEFVKTGAEKLPFQDKSFDRVISSLAFHHMPSDIKLEALEEIKRVLKTDGKLLLVDIGKPSNLFWKAILNIEALIEPKEYIKDNLSGKIPLMMKDSGFKVKEIHGPYFGIRFLRGEKKA